MLPKRFTWPMRLSLIVSLLGLLGLGALWATRAPQPVPLDLQPRQAVDIGGPFSLTNQRGETVSHDDFAGRYMLVFFGFTYCPDVCPTGLQILTLALDALQSSAPEKAAAMAPLFITIDPERDTVAALAEYLPAFHPRLTGLTGSQDQINQVLKHYKVYAARVADDSSAAGYTMDHSSFFYLMGPDGRFVKHFDHAIDPAELAQKLARYIAG